MSEIEKFENEITQNISKMGGDDNFNSLSNQWLIESAKLNYSYNFKAFGQPIIQYPQDIVAMQELIWRIKPDLIIETGIAHGGSLLLSASMMALLDYTNAVKHNLTLNPRESKRKVLGIDIDIRKHNLQAIQQHPLSHHIDMSEGSSIGSDTIEEVKKYAKDFETVLVCLDSNHTHQHVLEELNAYASLVSIGSYCVVFDTIIEDMPENSFPNRQWGKGNNPKTAVTEFIKGNHNFEIDHKIDRKLMITVAPNGYLKRVK